MSYDVHIHRADEHFDASENPIQREEWEAWVTNTPDFRFSESDYVMFGYEDGDRKERLAVWTEHPESEEFALYYYDGTVTTGNPDEHLLRRMAQIAHDLGARLQGDDGEFTASMESHSRTSEQREAPVTLMCIECGETSEDGEGWKAGGRLDWP